MDEETKIFYDKRKFTPQLSTNPALQRIIGIEESEDCQHKEQGNIFNKL